MKASSLENWIWVLIYGGLLVLVFGLALRSREPVIGIALVVAGAVAAVAGGVLIWVRSRWRDGGER